MTKDKIKLAWGNKELEFSRYYDPDTGEATNEWAYQTGGFFIEVWSFGEKDENNDPLWHASFSCDFIGYAEIAKGIGASAPEALTCLYNEWTKILKDLQKLA